MKRIMQASLAAAFGAMTMAGGAHAADCTVAPDSDPFDFDAAQVTEIYSCLESAMAEAYAKHDSTTAKEYRTWTNSQTIPAIEGAHTERFLMTFANDIAAEQYLKFEFEGVEMPVGSILAKESFKVRTKGKNNGKVVVGPLFTMEKVGLDAAPDTAGWLYGGVLPNGKDMKFKQSFCHNCHTAWEAQDSLAYPVEEARVGYTN